MPSEQNQRWLPVVVIAGALAAWGIFLAVGAYLAPEGRAAGGDHRKLWVVAATTGGFLLLWGLVLVMAWARPRRQARRNRQSREPGGGS